jgi:hypothetical protein
MPAILVLGVLVAVPRQPPDPPLMVSYSEASSCQTWFGECSLTSLVILRICSRRCPV